MNSCYVPFSACRDWPLYGNTYGRMKFDNLPEANALFSMQHQPFQGVTIVFKLFFAWKEQALGREMGLLGIISFLRWRFLGAARVFPVFFNVDMRRYAA